MLKKIIIALSVVFILAIGFIFIPPVRIIILSPGYYLSTTEIKVGDATLRVPKSYLENTDIYLGPNKEIMIPKLPNARKFEEDGGKRCGHDMSFVISDNNMSLDEQQKYAEDYILPTLEANGWKNYPSQTSVYSQNPTYKLYRLMPSSEERGDGRNFSEKVIGINFSKEKIGTYTQLNISYKFEFCGV